MRRWSHRAGWLFIAGAFLKDFLGIAADISQLFGGTVVLSSLPSILDSGYFRLLVICVGLLLIWSSRRPAPSAATSAPVSTRADGALNVLRVHLPYAFEAGVTRLEDLHSSSLQWPHVGFASQGKYFRAIREFNVALGYDSRPNPPALSALILYFYEYFVEMDWLRTNPPLSITRPSGL
jgi:hypothetical protein